MNQDYYNDVYHCLRVLKAGGIILYPTDTIWGLGCDATNEQAVDKIFALKSRADNKALIIFLKNASQISDYVVNPSPQLMEFQQKQSRPTTAIYNDVKELPQNLVGSSNSIAIRIPHNPFCKELLNQFNKPIVSTSANISGQPSPLHFHWISDKIKNGVDYIVKHRQDDLSESLPSMIVALENDEVKIIRQ